MRKILLSLAVVLALQVSSQAAVQLSTSASDPNAGNSLNLQLGQSGSMFVWISTDAGQTVAGIGLDVISSDATVLQGTANLINNSANRWLDPINAGTLGDLVTGSNAFALPGIAGTGLATNGQNDFALFSEVQFDATALGQTTVSLAINANGFGDAQGNNLAGQVNGVTGSVSVVTAVPEPSSLAILSLGTAAACWRRRRKIG